MKSNTNKFRISPIVFVLVTLSYSMPAQLSLENVYPVSANICELEVSGLK